MRHHHRFGFRSEKSPRLAPDLFAGGDACSADANGDTLGDDEGILQGQFASIVDGNPHQDEVTGARYLQHMLCEPVVADLLEVGEVLRVVDVLIGVDVAPAQFDTFLGHCGADDSLHDTMAIPKSADLVIVGAGTVGGWAAWFAATSGAKDVVVLEQGLAGEGASSRAAGVVRAQGGTPETVALGKWSVEFYKSQSELLGTDSGFRELGYLILAITKKDKKLGRERVLMQQQAGLKDVRWLGPRQTCAANPTLALDGHRGGSYLATDGAIDPPRNVRAYSLAMANAGVDLHERTSFRGLRTRRGTGGRQTVTGVKTSEGVIATERVLLTGGPSLRSIGALAGGRIPVGAARHQIAISAPDPAFDVDRLPMMFDLGAGLYWRLEEGGVLWGMSNPTETPGVARAIDWKHLKKMRRRLAGFVPATKGLPIKKVWAATIEYTPDHLPIVGPLLDKTGEQIQGASVASACGHGMMWGPAVSRIAVDLALQGSTDVTSIVNFGLDRFDEHGNSPFIDPVALPFPGHLHEDTE